MFSPVTLPHGGTASPGRARAAQVALGRAEAIGGRGQWWGPEARGPSAAGAAMLGTAVLRAARPGPLHGSQAGQQATSGDRQGGNEDRGHRAPCLPARRVSPGPATGVRASVSPRESTGSHQDRAERRGGRGGFQGPAHTPGQAPSAVALLSQVILGRPFLRGRCSGWRPRRWDPLREGKETPLGTNHRQRLHPSCCAHRAGRAQGKQAGLALRELREPGQPTAASRPPALGHMPRW